MKRLYMIGNSHIDPVWMWGELEGMMEVGATFRSALGRLAEFDGFVFTASSVAFYRWLEQHLPEVFEGIRQRVAEGRWEFVGGWEVEPDCNLPGGEGFVRQALYAQRYLHRVFGRICRVGYNVDSFGHGATLPQILKKCGLDYYVFMRPGADRLTLPAPVCRWQTPDGSEVLACRLAGEYTAWTKKGILNNMRASLEAMEASGLEEMPCFYGVGNHGGGPTIDNIKAILELRQTEKAKGVALDFGTLSDFFDDNKDRFEQTYAGEMQVIFDGCYAADSELKQLCRQAENMAVTTEKLNAMLGLLGQRQNRRAAFEQIWSLISLNQFHDVLAGTASFEGRNEAVQAFHGALSLCRQLCNGTLQALTSQIDTRGDGFPLVLLNPHGYDVDAEVVADFYWRDVKALRLKDYEGQDVYYQDLKSVFDTTRRKIVFSAQVPAMGYAVYRVIEEKLVLKPSETPVLTVTEAQGAIILENPHLRVTINPQLATVTHLQDKHAGYEALSGPMVARVYQDCRDTWGNQGEAWGLIEDFRPTGCRITEQGENRVVVTAWHQSEKATLTQRFILDKRATHLAIACDMVSFEQWKLIKLALPLTSGGVTTRSQMPYGFVDRNHADSQETFHHGYLDAFDTLGQGLVIANDGKFGYRIHEGAYELTLARSPIFAFATGAVQREDTHYEHLDQGRQAFSLALMPHGERVAPQICQRLADAIQQPVQAVLDSRHGGPWVERLKGLVAVDNPAIQVAVLKLAEDDGDSLVLRLFEQNREACGCSLRVMDQVFNLSFAPNELKTLCLRGDALVETNCLEGLV